MSCEKAKYTTFHAILKKTVLAIRQPLKETFKKMII